MKSTEITAQMSRFTGNALPGIKHSLMVGATTAFLLLPGTAAPPIGKTVSLKSQGNQKYVTADAGLDAVNVRLAANGGQAGQNQQFEVIDAGSGKVALKAKANGRYVCSDRALNSTHWPLVANRSGVGGSWERFSWIENSDGSVSLKADGNGRYVAADRGLDSANWPLAANRDAIGSWERFNIQVQSGSNPAPPTPTPTPPANPGNGLDGNKRPSDNFDLREWKITLPTGKEISETDMANGFQNEFFFTDKATGGVVFKSPNNGANLATTPNSTYLRCELREMLRAGNTSIKTKGINKNNWVLSSSSSSNRNKAGGVGGRLKATLRVDRVSTTGGSKKVGRTIIGQIHAKNDEPCRLYYRKLPGNSKGSIYFAHEPTTGSEVWTEIIGSRSNSAANPSDGIALGDTFSYTIDVSGTKLKVTISRPGKSDKSKTVDMKNSGFANDYLYFKAGIYNQNNEGSGTDYAQATFFALENSH